MDPRLRFQRSFRRYAYWVIPAIFAVNVLVWRPVGDLTIAEAVRFWIGRALYATVVGGLIAWAVAWVVAVVQSLFEAR
jgi:hypothetical protein